MSSNITITYNDISSIKSDLSILKGKAEKGVAVFQAAGASTEVKQISDLSFVLMETKVSFAAAATYAVIKTPTDSNASWVSGLQSSTFIVLSDVKSDSADKCTYSSALYSSIKSSQLGDSGQTIGEVKRTGAAADLLAKTVTVDILFISLNP